MFQKLLHKLKGPNKSDHSIENYLAKFLKNNSDVFFIQIGSNNGINNDPLRKFITSYSLKGILIEPVKYIFDELRQNYAGNKNLIFENIAVAESDGVRPFYRLKKIDGRTLPIWYDQLGSFLLDVILKHKEEIPDIEEHIIKEEINCLTFQSLISKHNIKKVDIIHIDTEGFDFEIIKLIDFSLIKPSILIYEHKHLSTEDIYKSTQLLNEVGYSIIEDGSDSLAKIDS
jgi:FkbM family methyltransferase